MVTKRPTNVLAAIGSRVVLLGSFRVPAAPQDVGVSSGEERVVRALVLLREALQIIDDIGEYPEVGAKLNDVVECLVQDSGIPPAP